MCMGKTLGATEAEGAQHKIINAVDAPGFPLGDAKKGFVPSREQMRSFVADLQAFVRPMWPALHVHIATVCDTNRVPHRLDA